jgi:hypothetical protein
MPTNDDVNYFEGGFSEEEIETQNSVTENTSGDNFKTINSCLLDANGMPISGNVFRNLSPALQPIVLADNVLVNAFGDTVGILKKQSEKNSTGKDETKFALHIEGLNTGFVWNTSTCIKPSYFSLTNPWQVFYNPDNVIETMPFACYTCKLIEFSFDAISIISNIIFKEWTWYILSLMVLLAGLYVILEYYKNLENITKEDGAKKLFLSLSKRVLIVVAAIGFLYNINGTIIAYVYKPITWAAIAMSDSFLSPDRQKSECGYVRQKEIFNRTNDNKGILNSGAGLTYSDAGIGERNDLTLQSNVELDLSQDVICSFFRIEEQIRMYMSLGFLMLSDMNFFKGILVIIIMFSFVVINLLWALYYIEVVFMVGLATIAIPFALIGWAVPIEYIKGWREKILKMFGNGASKLVLMAICTMIIGSFMSYIMFDIDAYELQKLLLSDDYNKIILLNLTDFKGIDFGKTIIGLIIIFYIMTKVKDWESDINSLIGGGAPGSKDLDKNIKNFLNAIKKKAVSGVTKKTLNKVKKKGDNDKDEDEELAKNEDKEKEH